jgi:hypothetical protein
MLQVYPGALLLAGPSDVELEQHLDALEQRIREARQHHHAAQRLGRRGQRGIRDHVQDAADAEADEHEAHQYAFRREQSASQRRRCVDRIGVRLEC